MTTLTAVLTQRELDTLRSRLCADRKAVTSIIESTKESIAALIRSRSSADGDDEHDPESATVSIQISESNALLEHARHHLDQVNVALAKFAANTYGRCEVCAGHIPFDRLEARPHAAYCVRCAEVVAS